MERVYSQSGDRIQTKLPVEVRRYGPWTRANHWLTAACLILLLISGLGFFHPSLYFLTGLFGGGQTARFLHPWIGVALFCSFFVLFLRMVRLNLPKREDAVWISHPGEILAGREEELPELGKYNAGQKFVFWAMTGLICVLIVSGIMMWEQYFDGLVPIPVRAHRHHRPRDRRRPDHPHLDSPRLRRDLDARHHPRDDPRHRHRRLGLAPPPQMAARTRPPRPHRPGRVGPALSSSHGGLTNPVCRQTLRRVASPSEVRSDPSGPRGSLRLSPPIEAGSAREFRPDKPKHCFGRAVRWSARARRRRGVPPTRRVPSGRGRPGGRVSRPPPPGADAAGFCRRPKSGGCTVSASHRAGRGRS